MGAYVVPPPTVTDLTDPNAPPMSQGKTKALWDAVRTSLTPTPPADAREYLQPPPQGASTPAPAPAPQSDLAAAVQAAGSQGPAPSPVALPPPGAPIGDYHAASTPPSLPPSSGAADPEGASLSAFASSAHMAPAPTPAATGAALDTDTLENSRPLPQMAAPEMSSLPSTARVTSLQQQIDHASHPGVARTLLSLLPLVAGAIYGKVGGGAGVSAGTGEGYAAHVAQGNVERKSLVDQLGQAQQAQTEEYQTAEKTRELANAAAEANRTRQIVASTGGQYRLQGSEVQAQGRQGVAQTGLQGRLGAANIAAQAARDVQASRADVGKYGADMHLAAAKYASDRALAMQGRSFAHSDAQLNQREGFQVDKPTAAEDQRMDLSNATQQYMKELGEIAARRPELFGPLQGRMTEGRAKIGSDDEDIAAIGRIQHNLGLTMNAAHSMRNASAIETAAQSAGNIHQTADSLIKNLQKGSADLDTFSTVHRPTLQSRVSPGSTPPARTPAPPTSGQADYTYVPGKGLQKNQPAAR